MDRVFLGLAIHNHQPLGNFPWVFEDAYRRAYLPMLKALERHPSIHVSLHYSGCLFDWISSNHPEFIELLKTLSLKGQVEMMGGGYYEPVLASIPDQDKTGQINKMSDFIEQVFITRPRGMWLAERVWEPGLAEDIVDSGLSWTLLDDTGFKMAGVEDDSLFGYFNTEEQGKYLKIFPISKYLRYSIPWKDIDEVLGYLKKTAQFHHNGIAVLGDDGEKFGIWPGTYEHCWEKHWVDDFFKAIEDNSGWLTTIKLGEYAEKYPPSGRVYLPCCSYDEMMEWSLPAERSWEYAELRKTIEKEQRTDILKYMYGGFWRNFMVKYPEINRMHKKMLLIHDKVHRAREINANSCGIDNLWRAQCNCPYWHGVFGGIYLSDIRSVTYTNLINAENCADRVLNNHVNGYEYQLSDFDGDGNQEILAEGRNFNLYVSPFEGGSIFEWDLRRSGYNLLGTVSRKPEAYHKELALNANTIIKNKENEVHSIHEGIQAKEKNFGKIIYDTIPRSSLIDRFLEMDVNFAKFEKNEYREMGGFSNKPYEYQVNNTGSDLIIQLKHQGQIQSDTTTGQLLLEKRLTLNDKTEELEIYYKFSNTGTSKIETQFGSEWNINLLGGGHNDSAYYNFRGHEINDLHLDSRGEIDGVQHLSLLNDNLNIEIGLNLDRPLKIWRFPVESISNSEGGVERVYQCSCILVLLPLMLEAGQSTEFKYKWEVEK